MKSKILVECYNDESLFFAFGKTKYEIEHNQDGKSEVLEKISKSSNCLGVVDLDKRINDTYLNDSCVQLEPIAADIRIYFDKRKNNNILVFDTKLEVVLERIIRETESTSTAQRLSLPLDWDGLHKLGKSKRNEFKNLCQVLINRSQELQRIKPYL